MGQNAGGFVEVLANGPLVRSRWIFNCYLVPTGAEGRPLLVDVGLPSHAVAVRAWLDHAGARLDGDVLALATHLHSDHVGGLPELDRVTRADVGLPARAKAYAAGETPRTPGLAEIARIAPVLREQRFDAGALIEQLRGPRVGYGVGRFALPVAEPCWLDAGPLGGAPGWEVLVTPGHTDDSVSYYHAESRTLCSGDAVLSVGGRAWFNPEHVDPAASAETEALLRQRRVDVLLPGHGRPVVGRDVLATAHGHDERLGWIPTCRRLLSQRLP